MDNKPFDYSEYGVFDGKPLIPSYNRKERRNYIKQHKHDKDTEYCQWCKINTESVTDDYCNVCCTLCGRIKEKYK